jgi:ABC-2 type transport system ATP-binding protein
MSSKNLDKWLAKGLKFFDLGEYEKAIKFFDKVIKNNPTNQEAWADKGATLINLGDCKEAINCLTKALELNPKNPLAWYNKGMALNDCGRYEEAVECFNKVLSLDPNVEQARKFVSKIMNVYEIKEEKSDTIEEPSKDKYGLPKMERKWRDDDITLKVEDLSKNYGNHLAVDRISFQVHRGETIGLVGPNGAGKTTTIKMIAKLLKPTTGRILLKNEAGELQDINKSSKKLIKIGFLIDIPAFYAKMTAYQVLKYCALLENYPKNKIDDRIDELLKLFKLYDWKHEKIKTFSKGMTQKLGIIQALLHDPDVVIMDEPQTGLDPKARIEIRRFIREIQKLGKTIFVASHMLYEISEVCDKIALINHGKIIAFDSIANLEKDLKVRDINCVLLEPIPPDKLDDIMKRLIIKLKPFLFDDLDESTKFNTIKYFPEKKGIKLFYDGKEASKGEILRVLVNEFKEDFTVISFAQPKSSQLERIYSEMIQDYGAKRMLKRREVRR